LTGSRRHSAAIVALIGYIVAGLLLEISHHDAFASLPHPVLSQHKCGAKELHIPIDHISHCLACSQSSQRVSTEAIKAPTLTPVNINFSSVSTVSQKPLTADVLHSGKRGPPRASA
jgi:hypothetical protein